MNGIGIREVRRSMILEDASNAVRLVMTDGQSSYSKVVAAVPNTQHPVCWLHQSSPEEYFQKVCTHCTGRLEKVWEMMWGAALLIGEESKAVLQWREMSSSRKSLAA